jgi:ribosome-binding protein aMBF1 (putative translation factor)
MARDKHPAPSHADDPSNSATSKNAVAKWRRLSPSARDFLARIEGREPLAQNLRKARENRGLSQQTVAKKLGLSRSLIAQIELANRPVSADELVKFANLYGTPEVELTGTRVGTDDPVTATLLNLAPALLKSSTCSREFTACSAR